MQLKWKRSRGVIKELKDDIREYDAIKEYHVESDEIRSFCTESCEPVDVSFVI